MLKFSEFSEFSSEYSWILKEFWPNSDRNSSFGSVPRRSNLSTQAKTVFAWPSSVAVRAASFHESGSSILESSRARRIEVQREPSATRAGPPAKAATAMNASSWTTWGKQIYVCSTFFFFYKNFRLIFANFERPVLGSNKAKFCK